MSQLLHLVSRVGLIVSCMVLPLPGQARTEAASPWSEAPEGSFKVNRFVLTRSVSDREPGARVTTVPCDTTRVYAFAELHNKGTRSHVVMVWEQDGEEIVRHRLEVGRSPSWRTWSYQRALPALKGTWTVTLLDASGEQLATRQLRAGE
jgi:hypothetical protein